MVKNVSGSKSSKVHACSPGWTERWTLAAAERVRGSLAEMGQRVTGGVGRLHAHLQAMLAFPLQSAVTVYYSQPGLLASSLQLSSPLLVAFPFPFPLRWSRF